MTAVSASSHSGSESTSNPSMSNSTAPGGSGGVFWFGPPRPAGLAPLYGEILRLGVVHDNGVGGLLGMQLHLLGQLNPDPGRLEQAHDLGPVGQVRAGGIADRVPGAAVAEPEEAVQVVGIGPGESELAPDPGVPVLGER